MRKLEVMRNNIKRFRTKREALQAHDKSVYADRLRPSVDDDEGSLIERVMAPPTSLVTDYYRYAEPFIREHILGDSTYTNEQHREMLERHLLDKWEQSVAAGAMCMSNRTSYWKPSVKYINGIITVYLANKAIATIS